MQEVIAELSADNLIYFNPENQEWELAEAYLSGNIREKIKICQKALAQPECENESLLKKNITKLKEILPEPCVPDTTPEIISECLYAMGYEKINENTLNNKITIKLGNSWIDTRYIVDFVAFLLKCFPSTITVSHNQATNDWKVECGTYTENNTVIWGTSKYTGCELIEHLLSNKDIKVYTKDENDKTIIDIENTEIAKKKAAEIQEEFQKWIWADKKRCIHLTSKYNELFNAEVDRIYDGSHIELIGSNPNITLKEHQKNGIWRILQSPATLIAYPVGYGKTYTMIGAIMELRRLGICNKPMLVVLNSTLNQIKAEFLKLYPNANILVAEFGKEKRKETIAKIATGIWDCILIPHSQFYMIKLSQEGESRFLYDELTEIELTIKQIGTARGLTKQLQERRKKLESRIKEINSDRKDDHIEWESLGIDALFIDEAQYFKNLGFNTKMHNVTGLTNTESDRALNTLMKVHYTLQNNGKVVFSTGTPVCNTLAELYTLQRYLDLEHLRKIGLSHFDAWASQFTETTAAPEITPSGNYKVKTRFRQFCNLPELMRLYRRFADVPKTIELNRPKLKIIEIDAPITSDQSQFLYSLNKRAALIHNKKVTPDEDNMLVVTSDGRKSSIDPRLVMPNAENCAYMKINKLIWNVWQIWMATKSKKSTQTIFCDFSTPNPDKMNAYDYIKQTLVKLGIPSAEIAYIHDYDSPSSKLKLFDKTNKGEIRIVLGSTEKLGTGVNIQKLLIAEHHLDAPWRPSDIEQRTGRIQRQGNSHPLVYSFRYVTKGNNELLGFDSFLWQALETKAKFIAQISTGYTQNRTTEDIDEAVITYSQIKAIATGNPLIIEQTKLEQELNKLKIEKKAWEEDVSRRFLKMQSLKNEIKSLPEKIKQVEEDIAALTGNEKITLYKNENEHTDEFFARLAKTTLETTEIGRAGKFTIYFCPFNKSQIMLKRNYCYYAAKNTLAQLKLLLQEGIHNTKKELELRLEQRKKDLKDLENHKTIEFSKQNELKALQERIHELNITIQKEDSQHDYAIIKTSNSEQIPPDDLIISLLRQDTSEPSWLTEIKETHQNNIIPFPVQKAITPLTLAPQPEVAPKPQKEYKFVQVKNTNIAQGLLF